MSRTPVVNEALSNALLAEAGAGNSIGQRYRQLRVLDEPPDADPHVRWCERGRLAAAPYSI
jgi:hypothetical protein